MRTFHSATLAVSHDPTFSIAKTCVHLAFLALIAGLLFLQLRALRRG